MILKIISDSDPRKRLWESASDRTQCDGALNTESQACQKGLIYLFLVYRKLSSKSFIRLMIPASRFGLVQFSILMTKIFLFYFFFFSNLFWFKTKQINCYEQRFNIRGQQNVLQAYHIL